MNLGTFTVLSRTLVIAGDKSVLTHLSADLVAGRSPQATVISRIGARGEFSNPVVLFVSELYVPGVSEVVLSGRVTAVDTSTGIASIGLHTFDYTSLLSNDTVDLKVGSLVRVRGTQPHAAQPILAVQVDKVSR
jgi:hypothetical protein